MMICKFRDINPPITPPGSSDTESLHRDFPVLEREDVAAIGFDGAVGAGGFEEPFGDASAAGDEVGGVVPAGVGEVF